MQLEELKEKLKNEIIEVLNLEEISPQDIDNDAPLFGSGLELDSIDSLELMVLLDRNYSIKIPDADVGRKVFHSIDTMAEYIYKNKK
ncbi:MAG TPA: phosphopantetheine-binding protein [Chitinophagaceae bacterium]|nr:phosphopantetheine-binding protein [Chitinophagaceae bacterium]